MSKKYAKVIHTKIISTKTSLVNTFLCVYSQVYHSKQAKDRLKSFLDTVTMTISYTLLVTMTIFIFQEYQSAAH